MNAPADPRQDRLYSLLPAIYRVRDEELGGPLRALLRVIAREVNVLEDDIAQLYDNWFIETCEDWVVPYLGDLLGWQPAASALVPRREMANVIRYRRRKGSLALLEQLSLDAAGWPARAVEFFKRVIASSSLNHLRPDGLATLDLHNGELLDLMGGPFDQTMRIADVRRIQSPYRSGRFNVPSVGLFVWRLRPYRVEFTPAYCLEEVDPHAYEFSVLGNDTPLFTRPVNEPDAYSIAGELNVPVRIRRHALEAVCEIRGRKRRCVSADYYGPDKSFAIWRMVAERQGRAKHGQPAKYVPQLISRESIVVSDLSDPRSYRPHRGTVAVDPELGRILFPEDEAPAEGVWVTYHYGFSADIGGGTYNRPILQPAGAPFAYYRVTKDGDLRTIRAAIRAWRSDAYPPADVIIEIGDSGVYTERLRVELRANERMQIRAARNTRPVIRLLDWKTEGPDVLVVHGEAGSRFALDGIMVAGRNIELSGDLAEAAFRHCTLVPGWTLQPNCDPRRPAEPSLDIHAPQVCVEISHSIVGSIQVRPDVPPIDVAESEAGGQQATHAARCQGIGAGVRLDPIRISITDSIVDATSDEREAIGAPGCPAAHARLTILRCTIFGQVQVHTVDLGEDSIFTGRMFVTRRQSGCLRFCSVVADSRTPRRYRCLPDLVDRDPANRDQERARVRPVFRSVRYGSPDYARLADSTAVEVLEGAHDESEMGVFHDLFQPQRLLTLRTRLEEFVPAAIDAAVLFAD